MFLPVLLIYFCSLLPPIVMFCVRGGEFMQRLEPFLLQRLEPGVYEGTRAARAVFCCSDESLMLPITCYAAHRVLESSQSQT